MPEPDFRAALTSDDIPPGPFSEDDLRQQWNAQADKDEQWDSLEFSEQLAWAQVRAIAADRAGTPPAPAADVAPTSTLPSHHCSPAVKAARVYRDACASGDKSAIFAAAIAWHCEATWMASHRAKESHLWVDVAAKAADCVNVALKELKSEGL